MSITVRVVLASLWTAAVIVGLSMPTGGLPDVDVKNLDKIVHLVLFFVFGFLWMAALGMEITTRITAVFIAGFAFAIATEVVQGLLPVGRQPDPVDVLADVIGLSIGIGLYIAVRRRVVAAEV